MTPPTVVLRAGSVGPPFEWVGVVVALAIKATRWYRPNRLHWSERGVPTLGSAEQLGITESIGGVYSSCTLVAVMSVIFCCLLLLLLLFWLWCCLASSNSFLHIIHSRMSHSSRQIWTALEAPTEEI